MSLTNSTFSAAGFFGSVAIAAEGGGISIGSRNPEETRVADAGSGVDGCCAGSGVAVEDGAALVTFGIGGIEGESSARGGVAERSSGTNFGAGIALAVGGIPDVASVAAAASSAAGVVGLAVAVGVRRADLTLDGVGLTDSEVPLAERAFRSCSSSGAVDAGLRVPEEAGDAVADGVDHGQVGSVDVGVAAGTAGGRLPRSEEVVEAPVLHAADRLSSLAAGRAESARIQERINRTLGQQRASPIRPAVAGTLVGIADGLGGYC